MAKIVLVGTSFLWIVGFSSIEDVWYDEFTYTVCCIRYQNLLVAINQILSKVIPKEGSRTAIDKATKLKLSTFVERIIST